jgi:chromosome segregation ATPase
MGTCTDTYVEMLQQDPQHHYRKHFEISEELGEALMASEAKDEELTAARRRLNLQMDTTAQVEKKLADALGVLSDRDIEVERLTFALKDKDDELESVRDEHRTQIDELMTELNDVKELYYNRLKIEEQQDEEIERLRRKNKQRVKVAELQAQVATHQQSIEALWACFNKE